MITCHILPTVILVGQAVDGEFFLLPIAAVDEDEIIFSLFIGFFGFLRHKGSADGVGTVIDERLYKIAIVGHCHDERK